MQANLKLKCVHTPAEKLRNRDREAENVIHKHSLSGREAENINALKLHQKAFLIGTCCGPFLQYWAGLPPAVLGPSIMSKGVETGPIATHFDPACAQTMPLFARF